MKRVLCIIVLISTVWSKIDWDVDGMLKDNRINPEKFREFFGLQKDREKSIETYVPDSEVYAGNRRSYLKWFDV